MRREPPHRVVTERLVLRCWQPADAPLLEAAVVSSLDHLRPWLPWAVDEPLPLRERVALLRRFQGLFDLGEDVVYGLFDHRETEVVGGSGLHARVGEGGLEIGYWIRASRVREGLATEATAALARVALEVAGVDRVEIHVDPANTASLGVPRALGFREEPRLPARMGGPPERDAMVFALFADDLPRSPVAAARLTAYDATGGRVL